CNVSFLFSSRRRHTRSKRDWSSDVCSSDLTCGQPHVVGRGAADLEREGDAHALGLEALAQRCEGLLEALGGKRPLGLVEAHAARSEERRVGKGCRTCWQPADRGRQKVKRTR